MTMENGNSSDIQRTKAMDSRASGHSPVSKTPDSIQLENMVGRQLRRLFKDVVDEPIPDEMEELLRQLNDKTS